jgi:hypothetical protein
VYDWLFEGRLSVYIPLIAAALVCLVVWKQTPRRIFLLGFAAAALLAGAYFLLDLAVETDREQIERKTKEMAGGVRAQNIAAILGHVSGDFRHGSMTRELFDHFAESAIRGHRVEEVEVWDFHFPDDFRGPFRIPSTGRDTLVARVSFTAKPKGGMASEAFYRCEAQFVRDPDGQWRLFDFRIFNPAMESTQPLEIPGM